MNPSTMIVPSLLVCLLALPVAQAAQPAMEQTQGSAKGAFLLHEGGNMHADQDAVRERRARAFEREQREAEAELMATKYRIIHRYLAKLPAHEQQALQAELAEQHATFQYRYPQAHADLLERNPHNAASAAESGAR